MPRADAHAPSEALVDVSLARGVGPGASTVVPSDRDAATRAWLRDTLASHGVWLVADHDPRLAPGFFVAWEGALDPDRLRRALRSWEAFDRAFDPCDATLEASLVDDRVVPCLAAVGLAEHAEDVLADHLVVVDERFAGSFPADRWQEHVARRAAAQRLQKPNDAPT